VQRFIGAEGREEQQRRTVPPGKGTQGVVVLGATLTSTGDGLVAEMTERSGGQSRRGRCFGVNAVGSRRLSARHGTRAAASQCSVASRGRIERRGCSGTAGSVVQGRAEKGCRKFHLQKLVGVWNRKFHLVSV
jgi:hypothetical protein